jgi:catechol 1,2-dioxygenase
MKGTLMDRRTFVGTGAAALAVLALPGPPKVQACPTPTTDDLYGYGPYYLGNAPTRARIAGPEEPGERLSLTGRVEDCGGPVAGVILEAWQATAAGCYVHPDDSSCPERVDPEETRLWAKLVSDAEGRFAFDTIKPGVYLNGAKYRPSHIHFRIRTPETAASSVDLVTQLYFQGDPYISGDYGADDPGAAARTIPLSRSEAGSLLQGVFNVIVPGGGTGIGRDPFSDPALRNFDVLVRRLGKRIQLFLPQLPAAGEAELRLYDARGILALRSLHGSFPIELDASKLQRGIFQAEMRWWTRNGLRKETVALRI